MPPFPIRTLGRLHPGEIGRIAGLSAMALSPTAPPFTELEKRLLEMGFIEGAAVALLHEGPLGGDPIVVQVGESRLALRRQEAEAVLLDPEPLT